MMAGIPADSIDLVMTSPPYADRRKEQDVMIPVGGYVDWFMPRAREMMRVLKRDGSLIVVIKEHTIDGERSEYVMDLVRAMRRQGWKWIDTYVWNKISPAPGFWPAKLKDGWEHCFHFGRVTRPKMYHDQVKFRGSQRMIDDARRYRDSPREYSSTNSKFSRKRSGFSAAVLPSNVLSVFADFSSKLHPTPFPEEVPGFFVRLLTREGDTVLDPFCGSGTTCLAAFNLNRQYVGIDTSEEYCAGARKRARERQRILGAPA